MFLSKPKNIVAILRMPISLSPGEIQRFRQLRQFGFEIENPVLLLLQSKFKRS